MTGTDTTLPVPDGAARKASRAERSVGIARIFRDASLALGPHRRLLAPISVLAVFVGVVETVVLYLIARLATVLSSPDQVVDISGGPLAGTQLSIGSTVLICLGLLVMALVLAIPMSSLTATLGARALMRERTRLVDAYLHAEWSYRSDAAEGHLQDLVGEYCQRAERVVQQVSTIVVAACGAVAICIGAVVIAPVAALVAIAGVGVIGVLVRPLTKRLKFGSTRFAEINRALAANVAQTARVSEEIASFDVSDDVTALLTADIERSGAAIKTLRLVSRLTPVIFQYGTLIIVVGLIGLLSVLSPEGLTALGAIVLLLVRVLVYLKQLQTASQSGLEMAPYVDALEGEIAMLTRHTASRDGIDLQQLDTVRFESVSFRYQQGKPALRDVSFTIEPGEAVGVVGPSGGGKSTTTHLLLRLRTPTEGRIMVGDHELTAVSPASWARLTARVPQDNKLISATVADNIRFFRDGFSDDDVVGAARAAHLHDEIVALPEGYQTLLGPAGRDLSGGQRQRIGIARALLGRPQLLILDEPTSALDGRSERLIQETLAELKGTTTLVVVAHRPATLEICDRILQVEHGRFAPASGVSHS